jgi:Family of unknown function (DUF6600)
MLQGASVRRLLLGLATSFALVAAGMTLPMIPGAVRPASAQISAAFQEALAPYGHWERHPRWGAVWVPDDVPPDWQPYEYGHWVYTDEWGWYWISDPEEEDWGWVAFHYGRWANDRRLGWFWIPDDEWAPAWVDWRYGGDYVGWAPMPPEEIIYEYDDNPTYWIFVAPRFLTAPRLRAYIVPRARGAAAFRGTHVVNRTVGYGRGHAAVNAGVSPAFVARATHAALPTYRVSPRVLSGTQGVAGAVRVTPQQLRAGGGGQRGRRPSANRVNAVAVQPTATTIAPAASSTAPAPLGKGERGKLGTHPPRAAQSAPPPAQPPAAPQARPERPLAPQTPPPPAPQQQHRPPPPVVTKPAPPQHVAPPAAAHPQPPAAAHPLPPAAARPQPPQAAKPAPKAQPRGKPEEKKKPEEVPK